MIFADWIYLYIALASVIFICLLAFRARSLKKRALKEFVSENLLRQLSYNHSKLASQVKFLVLIAGIIFVFAALARPQWGYTWQETKSKGTDIIFAIDCSKSMLADDLKPNRIERAKLAIEDALSYIEGDRIGIVAFSGIAFLQCPLTLDYNAFKMSLADVNTDLIDRGGTNISAAILEAESAFKASTGAKNIILLSDGEELEEDAIAQAKKLAESGIKIYTIGVGDTKLSPLSYTDSRGKTQYIRDADGSIVQSKLDEERLVQIANASGAFYARLGANGMAMAIDEIQKDKQELSSKMKRSAIERYQIFLGVGLILLCLESLIGTRKLFAKKLKNVALNKLSCLAIFALTMLSLPQNAKAQETPKELFNQAVLLAKEGDIEAAQSLYKKALQREEADMLLHAKIQYNLANIDYKKAQEQLLEVEDIQELIGATDQALVAYDSAKNQGEELLKEGNFRLFNDTASGTKNLEEQSFQDALKQNIQGLEGLKQVFEEFQKAKGAKLSSLEAPRASLNRAQKQYLTAQDLSPKEERIKANLQSASQAKALVEEAILEIENLSKKSSGAIEDSKKTLPTLIEDLKKLVRDNQENQDNQEQSQDSQSQDSQSQDSQSQDSQSQDSQSQDSQSQDSQSQESQSQESQSQESQSQESQSQESQSQESQSQESQSQDSQSQESQENQQGNDNQEQSQESQQGNESQQNQQNQQNQKGADEQAVDNRQENSQEEAQQGEENSQEQGAKGEDEQAQSQEASQGEQAQQGEQGEEGEEGEQAQQGEEQSSQGEQSEQATQGEEQAVAAGEASQEAGKEQASSAQDFRMREGAMTQREALQLLESTQDKGKHLPFKGFGNSKERYNQKNYKDW